MQRLEEEEAEAEDSLVESLGMQLQESHVLLQVGGHGLGQQIVSSARCKNTRFPALWIPKGTATRIRSCLLWSIAMLRVALIQPWLELKGKATCFGWGACEKMMHSTIKPPFHPLAAEQRGLTPEICAGIWNSIKGSGAIWPLAAGA